MVTSESTDQPNIPFGVNPRVLQVCLVAIFLIGALIRRDEIQAPGHLIEREYNSAIFARAFYANDNESVEQWQRDMAVITRDQFPMLEPPVTEYLVSLLYRIMGREEIWYSRYLTGLFWLVGGIFLYKMVGALASVEAAFIAVCYYLLVPWSIIISRSFQPDSLMMMMFLVSLYTIVSYFKTPSWTRLLMAGVLTGVTLLLRPLVLFTLMGAFVAISLLEKGGRMRFIDKRFMAFVFLSLLLPLAYYGYGIYIAGFLRGQAELSFRPYLLLRGEFWQGWFELGAAVAGYSFLILAILGFFMIRDKLTSFLIAGLMAGYLTFGLVFTYHIQTHPYYHIQLLPIMAICVSPLLAIMVNTFRRLAGGTWWLPVLACMFAVSYFSWREVKNTLYTAVFEDPALDREIGDIVGHSPRTVFVAYHYGLPMEYYGELAGGPWPVSIDAPLYRQPDARELSVQERLDGLGFIPEYFVITNFDLYYRKHQDLQEYLENNCSLFAKTDQYMIYSKCRSMAVK